LKRQDVVSDIAELLLLTGVLQDRASSDTLDLQTHSHTHYAGRSGEMGQRKQGLTAAQV
jgi:hypothetical protein